MVDQRAKRREDEIKKNQKDYNAPKGSFSNYTPVPGKPGFYTDEFGHLKYVPK